MCEKYLQHYKNQYNVFIDFKKTLTVYGMQPYGIPSLQFRNQQAIYVKKQLIIYSTELIPQQF